MLIKRNNKKKKYIPIRNEPEIESVDISNPFQSRGSSKLELDSYGVDPDFLAEKLKNKIKELEEENSAQLPMLSNNIFDIKTEPMISSLEQETNAFSAEFNIKHENEEDYTSISSRRSKAQSGSSRSHSSYSEYSGSVTSTIPYIDSGSSQQGLNLISDLEEASNIEKRRRTLNIALDNGKLVVLTNNKKATWSYKSEFQLYENQVELWENLSEKTKNQLKKYSLEKFKSAIKDKCRDRETLGITLNNRERVVLNHPKATAWNKLTIEKKNELQKLGEKEFFKEINKKVQEAKSLKIILTPEEGQDIEVSLNHVQVSTWNKSSEGKKQELQRLGRGKFFKEINKEVGEHTSLEIILDSGEKAKLAPYLVSFWRRLSVEEQKLRKAGSAQDLIEDLKDTYNQEARTKRLATKKISKSSEEMNLMKTSSVNQDSNGIANETMIMEENSTASEEYLTTSEEFEETDEYKREAIKRKRIAEEPKDDDLPIITKEYNYTPYKKRKIYSVKEKPREIYEEENNININEVPSKLSSVTVTGPIEEAKDKKSLITL